MDAAHWTYKGEGNANLVLSYTGPEPALTGRVLRLRKATDDDVLVSEPSPYTLDDEIGFQSDVIAPLLGPEYVAQAQLVNVTPEFLQAVSQRVSAARPAVRRSRPLDLSQPHAALIKDLTYVPQGPDGKAPASFAVEIKHEVKRRTCRYCMHQQWKAKAAADKQHIAHSHVASTFCPLDLYSRDRVRVRAALDALLQNPQNNLRLFIEGHPTPLNSDHAQTVLAEQLQTDAGNAMDVLFEHLTQILISDNLLPRLRQHQQGLDRHDIEGVFPLYNAMSEAQQAAVPSLTEWKETISVYLARETNLNRTGAADTPLTTIAAGAQIIREYLVSATLKDCSVIISLWDGSLEQETSIEPNEGVLQLPDGGVLRYRVGVLDIDPKRAAKIPAHYTLDRDIVK
ncbi:Inositol-pentakisphosphate 2-kinase [Geranomyces michiganensis]|nr:Inositol-pentakisphosphate 2-kinase [Geranomyces michiganensis]